MYQVEFAQRAIEGFVQLLQHTIRGVNRKDEREIILDIRTNIRIRTLRSMLILFDRAGYQILLRARFNRWLLSIARSLMWHPTVKLEWRDPAPAGHRAAICTDDARLDRARLANGSKVIHLRYDYGPRLSLGEADFAMPYLMHAQLYVQYHADSILDQVRQNPKKIRILFAGNSNSDGYNSPIFHELFHLNTRHEILSFLDTRGFIRAIQNQAELDSIIHAGCRDRLVLIDTERFRILQDHWLDLVSRSDFFLCPPGLIMPMCHNAIEAIAVGTIPLINYPNWFLPRLTDGANCVAFSTLDELASGLERIFRMDADSIAALRRGVIQYYLRYLQPESFVQRLMDSPAQELSLHVLEEDVAVLRRVLSE